jgi:hypothetical protein
MRRGDNVEEFGECCRGQTQVHVMENACHVSIRLIGLQWDECIDRFERHHAPIDTQMIRNLGKLTVMDNDGVNDCKLAAAQVEIVWGKLESREC